MKEKKSCTFENDIIKKLYKTKKKNESHWDTIIDILILLSDKNFFCGNE